MKGLLCRSKHNGRHVVSINRGLVRKSYFSFRNLGTVGCANALMSNVYNCYAYKTVVLIVKEIVTVQKSFRTYILKSNIPDISIASYFVR